MSINEKEREEQAPMSESVLLDMEDMIIHAGNRVQMYIQESIVGLVLLKGIMHPERHERSRRRLQDTLEQVLETYKRMVPPLDS